LKTQQIFSLLKKIYCFLVKKVCRVVPEGIRNRTDDIGSKASSHSLIVTAQIQSGLKKYSSNGVISKRKKFNI